MFSIEEYISLLVKPGIIRVNLSSSLPNRTPFRLGIARAISTRPISKIPSPVTT